MHSACLNGQLKSRRVTDMLAFKASACWLVKKLDMYNTYEDIAVTCAVLDEA